jgi:hypothetical protein
MQTAEVGAACLPLNVRILKSGIEVDVQKYATFVHVMFC